MFGHACLSGLSLTRTQSPSDCSTVSLHEQLVSMANDEDLSIAPLVARQIDEDGFPLGQRRFHRLALHANHPAPVADEVPGPQPLPREPHVADDVLAPAQRVRVRYGVDLENRDVLAGQSDVGVDRPRAGPPFRFASSSSWTSSSVRRGSSAYPTRKSVETEIAAAIRAAFRSDAGGVPGFQHRDLRERRSDSFPKLSLAQSRLLPRRSQPCPHDPWHFFLHVLLHWTKLPSPHSWQSGRAGRGCQAYIRTAPGLWLITTAGPPRWWLGRVVSAMSISGRADRAFSSTGLSRPRNSTPSSGQVLPMMAYADRGSRRPGRIVLSGPLTLRPDGSDALSGGAGSPCGRQPNRRVRSAQLGPAGPHQQRPSDFGLGLRHSVDSPMSVAGRGDRRIIRVGDVPRVVDARMSLALSKGGGRVGDRGSAFQLKDPWGPSADAVVRRVRREKLPARIDVTGFQDCCSSVWRPTAVGDVPVSAAWNGLCALGALSVKWPAVPAMLPRRRGGGPMPVRSSSSRPRADVPVLHEGLDPQLVPLIDHVAIDLAYLFLGVPQPGVPETIRRRPGSSEAN